MFSEFKNIDDFKDQCGYTIDGVDGIRAFIKSSASRRSRRSIDTTRRLKPQSGAGCEEQSAKEGTLIHETVEGLLLGKQLDIPR